MIQFSQENRQARIDTPLGSDKFILQAFSGSEGLSKGFEYNASVTSLDPAIDGNEIIGKKVSVTYYGEDGRERFFSGHVSRFEYSQQVEKPVPATGYQLTIVPWLWFLNHNADCQIFQNEKTPAIIEQIFRDLGFNDFELNLTASYNVREYCVQYRETDFNFISRLMEEEGIFYYFKHEKKSHKMILCDSTSGYYDLGEPEVRYGQVGQSQFAQLTGWKHVYEFRPGKIAQKDFNFKKPTDALQTKEKSSIQFEKSSGLELYDYPGLYEEAGPGKRLTKVRLEEQEAEHDHVLGSGSYLSFTPGGKFEVQAHSRATEKGKSFTLVEVFTELSSNAGQGSSSSHDFSNVFRCIPSETIYRPQRSARKPIVEGPQTAIVATDGQEIVVDEHARVKVQFHWDRYGKSDINSSCWIRVSQHHAGKGWGMIDIPRKDEEVIVSFLEGDPDRPIITGRVYNGDNQPPYNLKGAGDNAKNKTRRGNTTKSYEATGYNEMTMDDTAGKEQIRIHGQYDMATTVEHDQTLMVVNDRTNTVTGKFTETITKDTKIEVTTGPYSHTVAANTATYHVEGDLTETYNANQKSSVTGAIEYTAGKTILIKAEQSITLMVGSSKMIMDTKGVTIHGPQHARVDAAKVEVTGKQEAKLGVGGQNISCDKTKVNVSGAAINSSAIGMHEVTGAVVKIN